MARAPASSRAAGGSRRSAGCARPRRSVWSGRGTRPSPGSRGRRLPEEDELTCGSSACRTTSSLVRAAAELRRAGGGAHAMIRDDVEPHTRVVGSRRRSTPGKRGTRATWTTGEPGRESAASARVGSRPDPSADGMRVLVTNPWNGQAYCVLRSLRGHASRVVATVYREHGVLGRLAPAAVSRFVDRVYPVPSRHPGLATRNTRRGEQRRGGGRTSGPSSTSASARGSTRSSPRGIPRSSFSRRTRAGSPRGASPCRFRSGRCCNGPWTSTPWSEAATELGFPCPRTYLPGSPEDAVDLAQASRLPGRRQAALLREGPRIGPRHRPGQAGGDRPAGPADLRDADAPGVDSRAGSTSA